MKPKIIWLWQLSRWICFDHTTKVVGLGHNPSDALRWYVFGKRSMHGTGRR